MVTAEDLHQLAWRAIRKGPRELGEYACTHTQPSQEDWTTKPLIDRFHEITRTLATCLIHQLLQALTEAEEDPNQCPQTAAYAAEAARLAQLLDRDTIQEHLEYNPPQLKTNTTRAILATLKTLAEKTLQTCQQQSKP